jgi:AcrR family transcriptional regulator
MPPAIKITKEAISESAFQLTRESGIQAVNARELAKRLGCSTQPIFRVYENMEQLKQELYRRAEAAYEGHLNDGMNHPIPFLGIGLAYIDFAQREKNLFKLLFMSEHYEVKSVFDMVQGDDNDAVVGMIAAQSGLDMESAQRLFVNTWLITHGIASLSATNTFDLDKAETENILKDTFLSLNMYLKSKQPPKADE